MAQMRKQRKKRVFHILSSGILTSKVLGDNVLEKPRRY
jgi:hypothetical protein